ncbi:MAG: hypothetical protein PHW69_00540 [Elusimicrobiaceae bacterium]|nr:hypothetical protein [Elusimicrobiaceae bacterium]
MRITSVLVALAVLMSGSAMAQDGAAPQPAGAPAQAAAPNAADSAYPYQFDNSYFGLDSSDMMLNYIRFFMEPTYKIKDQYSAGGFGAEAGVIAAYRKGYPYVGFSVGGFGFDSADSSDYRFTTIPVLVRAGADFPITPNSQFSLVVGGGYSINDYASSNPAVSASCGNSYLLQGQIGVKFPVSSHIMLGVYGGYSYMKPYIGYTRGGLTEGDYKTVDAPFVKLLIQL